MLLALPWGQGRHTQCISHFSAVSSTDHHGKRQKEEFTEKSNFCLKRSAIPGMFLKCRQVQLEVGMAQASAGWQNPQHFQDEFNITKSMLWKISIKIVENKATNCLGQTSIPYLGTWPPGVKPQYPREVGSSGKACAAVQALGRRPGSLHHRGERRPDTGALPLPRELADAPHHRNQRRAPMAPLLSAALRTEHRAGNCPRGRAAHTGGAVSWESDEGGV